MLPQEAMIERVRELCDQDERVVSALMYGSFALGQGDRFSDIEFYLFFAEQASERLHEEAWVGQIAPLALYYVNEFGNGTAIFDNLVRGEFHFEAASDVGLVDAWESAWFPSLESAVLVDKNGELSGRMGRLVRRSPDLDTPERSLFLSRSLTNWTLMGANLLERGEYARAEAFLTPGTWPSAAGHAVGGRQQRELVEPHAQARGRRFGQLLQTVQGVHGGTGSGAARPGLRLDVGVG
jgi:lincosamide nucleotidyltransferase B/F